MRFLVTTSLALWGAMLVSGCSSGSGPATTPFNPFGTEPPGTTSEPPGGSNNNPPPPSSGSGGSRGLGGSSGLGGSTGSGGSGGSTLAQLCAAACANFESFCSSYQSATCPSDCAGGAAPVPNCQTQYQAFVSCLATTSYFTCDGSYTPQAPDCVSAQDALTTCASGA